jgi:hypothetical protein
VREKKYCDLIIIHGIPIFTDNIKPPNVEFNECLPKNIYVLT